MPPPITETGWPWYVPVKPSMLRLSLIHISKTAPGHLGNECVPGVHGRKHGHDGERGLIPNLSLIHIFGSITTLDDLSYKTAFGIGCFQVLSLIPGTSRSGSTIIGGLLDVYKRQGLHHHGCL